MGKVLSRANSAYKLAGMKENGIFEEQQEIWRRSRRGLGRREVDTVDNRELSEVWQKNEAIWIFKKSFKQQCGDDREGEIAHGGPVTKWWQQTLGIKA